MENLDCSNTVCPIRMRSARVSVNANTNTDVSVAGANETKQRITK